MKNKKRLSRTAKLIRIGTREDDRRRKQIERDHVAMFGMDYQHAPVPKIYIKKLGSKIVNGTRQVIHVIPNYGMDTEEAETVLENLDYIMVAKRTIENAHT